MQIRVPKKLLPVFQRIYNYKILLGGRASGKTATIIRYLIMRAKKKKILILCTRQYQSSIETSTYAELRDFIIDNNMLSINGKKGFIVKHDKIEHTNGSSIIFKGLERDIMSIKSIPKIMICFIEEAETIGDYHYSILIPTVRRNQDSEIIVAFNPTDENSATYKRFVTNFDNLPQPNLKIEINYDENPYVSQNLLDEIETLKLHNYALFEHIYLGKLLNISEQVIFKDCFEISEIDVPLNCRPYIGMDFGFANDQFACCECYEIDKHTIYIKSEIYELKLLPNNIIPTLRKLMPVAINKKIWADNQRADTIAQLAYDGLNIEGAEKGPGSIESGIQWLQSKRIIIHPKCIWMKFEAYNYKFDKDKEGNIIPEPIDKHNHLWDAVRYAFVQQIKASKQRPMNINPALLNKVPKHA